MENIQMNQLMQYLKDADQNVKDLRSMIEIDCAAVGLSINVIDDLAKFKKEQIEEFTPAVCTNIYEKFKDTAAYEYPEGYDERAAKVKENILSIYDSSISYAELVRTRDELAKEIKTAIDDYSTWLASDEVAEMERKQVEDLKDQINSTTEGPERNRLLNRLKAIENSETLNFFFDRINQYKEKEVARIADAFFDKHVTAYTKERYEEKMRRMKYNPDICNSFLGIEELFLGEEYYPYNNLFRFAMIRYIAHIDINSDEECLYAQSILTQITKFVIHKLDEEKEAYVKDMIKRFDDKFKGMEARFIEKNITSPTHSYRIMKEEIKKTETLAHIEDWFQTQDINLPTWYSYEEKVDYFRTMQEKVAIKSWLTMYEIEYPDNATLEQLREIKDSYDGVPVKEEEKPEELDVSEDGTLIDAETGEVVESDDDGDIEVVVDEEDIEEDDSEEKSEDAEVNETDDQVEVILTDENVEEATDDEDSFIFYPNGKPTE